MRLDTLTIVGVGLIGGSIGLAAKARGLARRVIGVGRRQESLDEARRLGAIDAGVLDLAAGVNEAEFVVFAGPVQVIVDQVREAAGHCRPGTILTDAGSVKEHLVASLEGRLPRGVCFVGGHPLAGSEKKGPAHASADLFRDRLVILTPGPDTDRWAISRVSAFWQALGSRVREMPPEAHDRALAFTSHLPHLLASALAGCLPESEYELAASGFRDTTRIAAGDPSIWTGIFLLNREPVLQKLALLETQLSRFRDALRTEDAALVARLLTQGKQVRDALGS